MKNSMIKGILITGYCVPFVFLAMNEDITVGTLWFYLVMAVGFGLLCYGSVKVRSPLIVVIGNILSFVSSYMFTCFLRTEKWGWYFKPFTPYQLLGVETIFVFLLQIVVVICALKKQREGERE